MITRILLSAAALLTLQACETTQSERVAASPPITAGMVSAADPRAAKAGAEILRKGGSATDAAIAVMLALTVVEPQSSGIGGGGFYLRGTADGTVETLDGRETAPVAATPRWFLGTDGKALPFRDAVKSGLSIGVPGNMALAAKAHARHGKLPWATLFDPAIRLAREGWTISERFHTFLGFAGSRASRDPAGKALFFDTKGKPLPVGTHVRNRELADTLSRIAREGPGSFYGEPLGDKLAQKIAGDTPGTAAMTAQDITGYQAKWRDPVCGTYRAHRICGMGPPSSGATTVLAILGQLEHFNLAELNAESPVFWHLFAESQRLAYADRARFLADADFVTVPVNKLINSDYLAKRGATITSVKTLANVQPGFDHAHPEGDEPAEQGTSHFAVVDAAGNAVSYTSTIEGPFGSGLMFGGFYLNNELTDFSRMPEKDGRLIANRVEGGKRPLSSMAPTLVYGPDGRLKLAIGAAGGGTIPVQVARALIGVIDWDMELDDALALPVLYSPGGTVVVEQGSTLEAMVPAIKALGHEKVMPRRLPIKVNAIAIDNGTLNGAADPRSEGAVATPYRGID